MKIALTMRQVKLHDKMEDLLFQQVSACSDGALRARLLLSRQLWRDNGKWERYYQAREGRVHASRYCSTLSESTKLVALWELSGDPVDEVVAAGVLLCRRCFPEAPAGGRRTAVVCPGSGEMSRCRCGDRRCRQMCAHCGQEVLITPSGVLRRHGQKGL